MRGPRLRGDTMSATRPYSSPVVLQRKLTLDDFPMEHGVKDALLRSLTSRQERSKLQDRLKSARKESETLREYSRRRFQTVVDWESGNAAPSPQQSQDQTVPKIHILASRPKTTASGIAGSIRPMSMTHPPQTPCTPTNGPTKDGSILYNGKPLLLSSIRTRPSSEPPSRFDHMRGSHGKTYPYIQRTLEQSNCEYRVGATPCHTARDVPPHHRPDRGSSFSPNFVMLIPVTSAASDFTADGVGDLGDGGPRWKKGQAWTKEEEGGSPLLASTARSRSPRSEEMSESRVDARAREDTRGQGQAVISRESGEEESGRQTPPAARTTRLKSSSATTTATAPQTAQCRDAPVTATHPARSSLPSPSSRRSPTPGAADKDRCGPPPTQPPRMTISPALVGSSDRRPGPPQSAVPASPAPRPGSGKSRSSVSSGASSFSSVSLTPRPRCWVDDVTVSSDGSLAERELSVLGDLEADRLSMHSSQDRGGGGGGGAAVGGGAQGGQASSPRVSTPSGAEKRKTLPLGGVAGGRMVGSPLLKRSPSGGKAKAGAGGCPRSLKQSTVSEASRGDAKSDRGAGRECEGAVGFGGEGEETVVVALPRFVCPSSESKSRQAALKEWLAKTSFGTACRTVPLM